MRIAVINNGIVENVCDGDESFRIYVNGVASDTAKIGDIYDGAIFTTPPLSAEEIAAAQLAAADAAALSAAKADATIKYLVNHTPAEVQAKVLQLVNASGVTNLATAQVCLVAIEDLLIRMAIALSVAAKDRLR